VVVRVQVWAMEERGRWTFKADRAWDTMPLKAAQKPSRRPPMRAEEAVAPLMAKAAAQTRKR
jgi:hypothetical protein